MKELLKSGFEQLNIEVSEKQIDMLVRYSQLLVEWNEKMNLTAITDPEGIAVKHFLDCLAYLKRAKIPEGARVADVGTGAGFPGVVLKIARPDIKLVLIDSLQKRLNFLDTVLNEIGVNTHEKGRSFQICLCFYATTEAITQKIARLTTVRMEQTPEAMVKSSLLRPRLGAR